MNATGPSSHRVVRSRPPSRPGFDRSPIDAFTAARMAEHGLEPSPPAGREELIRRLSLDLTGLPPTLDEIDAYLDDHRDDAEERLVDRLLAKPAYGERWARVWLDLARYADSKGYGSDPLRTIWRYRDWVIDAYNRNLPFDQFTIEQLAGDLLPDARLDQQLATAFHRNTMTNTEGGTDDEEFRVAAVKDRTNTTGQVWLGLTLGCAQCHSHKFDPISQHEYYSLLAFFNQTEDRDLPNDNPRLETPTAEQRTRRDQIDSEIARLDAILANPEEERLTGFDGWTRHAAALAEQWIDVTPEAGLDVRSPALIVTALRLQFPKGVTAASSTKAASESPVTRLQESPLLVSIVHSEPREVHGQRVRIRIPGPNRILSLAEVQVLSGDQNVARQGTARQSSTAYNGPPELAVDGNTSGVYSTGSVTHTETEADPWWEVDLGEEHHLDAIVVWNRTDGNLEARLDDFEVHVLDAAGQITWRTTVENPPEPTRTLQPGRDDSQVSLRPPTDNLSDAQPSDAARSDSAVVVWEFEAPRNLEEGTRLHVTGPWSSETAPDIALTRRPASGSRRSARVGGTPGNPRGAMDAGRAPGTAGPLRHVRPRTGTAAHAPGRAGQGTRRSGRDDTGHARAADRTASGHQRHGEGQLPGSPVIGSRPRCRPRCTRGPMACPGTAWDSPSGSCTRTTRSPPASRSTACGPACSAAVWSKPKRTSETRAPCRVIRNCSTGWPSSSCRTAGTRKRC